MTSRALVLATAALAVSFTAFGPAWAAKAKKATPAKSRPAATAPAMQPRPAKAQPADDQSYLRLSPGSAAVAGPPDWVTSGARRSNQPWANTQFDWWGDFSAR